MNEASFKKFFAEVKETLKLTKDSYFYLSLLMVLFVTIISVVLDYYIPGIFIALLLFAVAPLLMALSSYYVAPIKQELEQKQKYFFRLVKQFFRFDSIRIMVPLRTILFAFLFSIIAFYIATSSTIFYAINNDPTVANIYADFLTLIETADYDQALVYLNDNLDFLNSYSFIPLLAMSFTFVFTFVYMLIKRFFFVFIHVNLFTKTRAKVDQIKQKYFNQSFARLVYRKYNLVFILPLLLLAAVISIAIGILVKQFWSESISDIMIVLLTTITFITLVFASLRYIFAVLLVIFGIFMEQYGINIYNESIRDIDLATTNPQMSNEEKQRLGQIRKLLEAQITLVKMEKDKKETNADTNSEIDQSQ